MFKALKRFVREGIYTLVPPPKLKVRNSNSQAGEDRILNFLFESIGVSQICYVDVGANDPIIGNNTYIFSKVGNRGVLVEPDPSFFSKIQLMRPNDTVVQAAVSDREGEANFFVFDEPSVNTLSEEEANIRKESGKYKLIDIRPIRLITLETIFKEYLQGDLPHVISLDVEGVDFVILNSFDFNTYPVPVWVIETCEYSENHIKPKVHEIFDLMAQRGYFVYADTYINTIFVRKNWFDNFVK